MIQLHPRKTLPHLVSLLVLALLAAIIFVRPVAAEPSETDEKAAAVAAMEKWMKLIDEGNYAQSWKEASAAFQKALTEEQWAAASRAVREPLGRCKDRTLASVLIQNEIPAPGGEMLKGTFAIAQFKSSFENLFQAVETVTFEREKDGEWRASGYFIKPEV